MTLSSPIAIAPSVTDPALSELADAYRARRLIVFAGDGIARSAGLPSRAGLVALLLARCDVDALPEDARAELQAMVDKERWQEALSALRDRLGTPEFGHLIERYLDDNGVDVPPLANAIARLSPALRGVITTSLDRLMDRALRGAWTSFAGVTRDIPQRERYILKLHGMLSDRATWVLTREDASRALHDPERRAVLTALFHAYTIAFVGYDFTDDVVQSVLDQVGSRDSAQPPRHFALVSTGVLSARRRHRLAEAGVRLLDVPQDPVAPGGVVSILNALADAEASWSTHLRALPSDSGESSASGKSSAPSKLGATSASRDSSALASSNVLPIGGPATGVQDPCPFPGLASFTEAQSHLFYGRDAEVSAALQRLGDTRAGHRRWLYIDGPSGAGKSSLVRAGLIPKVRAGQLASPFERWQVAVFRPGTDPVWNLAQALCASAGDALPADVTAESMARAFAGQEQALARWLRQHTPRGCGFLLVVDQLEEAFTLADAAAARKLDALLGRALADKGGPLYLVTTVRGDFTANIAELPTLEIAFNQDASRYYLRSMSAPGLRAAITEPARRAGLSWDEHLVDRIIKDSTRSDSGLPLVAYALQAMWLERDGERLTFSAYERLGGVGGALTRSADAILHRLSPADQERARELFLCLAAIDPRGAYTRQPISRGEALRAAGGGKRGERILSCLSGGRSPDLPDTAPSASARLLAVTQERDGDRVDLVHEALLQEWATLRGWLDESRKELLLHDDLRARYESWQRAGRSPRGLPRGGELEYFLKARRLSDGERQFLDEALRKQRSRRRRLMGAMAGLLIAVIGVSWLALFAFAQRNDARANARRAEAASAQAKLEAQRAEEETQRAEEETQRAESEAQRAQAAETEIKEQLQQLELAKQELLAQKQQLELSKQKLNEKVEELEESNRRERDARERATELAEQMTKARQKADELAKRARQAAAEADAARLKEQQRVKELEKQLGGPVKYSLDG